MKFIPNAGKLLVKRSETESKTPGGIIIPEQAKQKSSIGEVLAVGVPVVDGEVVRMPAIGSCVYFAKYAGSEIEVGEEKLLVLSHDDVLGTLEK